MPERIEMDRPKRSRAELIDKEEAQDDIIGNIGKILITDYSQKGRDGKIELLRDKSKSKFEELGFVYYTRKKINGKTFYHVDLARGSFKFAGFRMIPIVYQWLITQYDMPLQAGKQQSAGGRGIWNTLAGMKGVKVYAVTGKEFVELQKGDSGELVGKDDEDYSPYDNSKTIVVAMKG